MLNALFFHEIKEHICNNSIFILREDLIPFSFGGNKARKGILFFEEIDSGGYDCVVTYGSNSSNHVRVIANLAAQREMPCIIISPDEGEGTFNNSMTELFGAKRVYCNVREVKEAIDRIIEELQEEGYTPYFIMGGGHGNIGTHAYVQCYEEIREYERKSDIKFDYIFHASGTGTTQAGLVSGQLLAGDEREIIGISIARRNPYGRDVVRESIVDYFQFINRPLPKDFEEQIVFLDDYIDAGYGTSNEKINAVIKAMVINEGICLDPTYTGKAYHGMMEHLRKNEITGKNILFIHTGGMPLFFDWMKKR